MGRDGPTALLCLIAAAARGGVRGDSILGKLPVVPVGDFGTVPHSMRAQIAAQFPGALADRTPGAGDGCPVWYVNSWALGWSRET